MVWGWRGRGWEGVSSCHGCRDPVGGDAQWDMDTVGAQPLQSFILGSNKGQTESMEPPSRAQHPPLVMAASSPSPLHATGRDVCEHLQRHEQPSSLQ